MWKKVNPVHCWLECKLVQSLWKIVWRFLKKLKIELPYDPAIPLLDIYPTELKTDSNRYLYANIHNGIIHNRQKVETIQAAITR